MIIYKHKHQSEQYMDIVKRNFIIELNLNIYLLGIETQALGTESAES